jgi:outer membrane protein assembly factor BamA
LKQDTSFLLRTFEPVVGYRISRELRAQFRYTNERAALLNPTAYSNVVWPPPPVLNSRTNILGLGLEWERLDFRLNPRKGIYLRTDVGYGTKRISPVQGLDSLDFSRLPLLQPRTELELEAFGYIPTFRKQVLVLGNRSYILQLRIYQDSDQRFIGGGRVLRGFNENEFLASRYSIFTAEYRLQIGQLSYIGTFADAGLLEYRQLAERTRTLPFGLGLVLAVETPAGVMQVSYAIGGTADRSLQPARGRIHIGLVNNF